MGSQDLQLYQKLELLVTKGSIKDKKIVIENGNIPVANNLKYKVNDKVMVTFSKDFEDNDTFYITDYVRRSALLWLFVTFVIIAVAVGRWQGMTSLFRHGDFFSGHF